jgi:hypothetical protein
MTPVNAFQGQGVGVLTTRIEPRTPTAAFTQTPEAGRATESACSGRRPWRAPL